MVELPSPYAGVVAELLVAEGQTVDVGTPIIAVETARSPSPPLKMLESVASATAAPAAPERQPVLVGYGVKSRDDQPPPAQDRPVVTDGPWGRARRGHRSPHSPSARDRNASQFGPDGHGRAG